MGKINIKVQIDPNNNRKTNPSKTGNYPVYVMIRQDRKKERIALNFPNISPGDFQPIQGSWIKKSCKLHKEMNSEIEKISFLINRYLIMHPNKKLLNPKNVKEWYLENHGNENEYRSIKQQSFQDYFEEYTYKNAKGSKNYITVLSKIQAFDKPVDFHSMDRDWAKTFYKFLKNDPKHKVFDSSGALYLQKIKTVYREWAIKLEQEPKIDLFRGLNFSTSRKREKIGLSMDQLKSLGAIKFGESEKDKQIEDARDFFIFMCWTSRYYSELQGLTFEENYMYDLKSNSWSIRGQRKKTDEEFINPLAPKLVRNIFDKLNPIKSGIMFPTINYKYPSVSFTNIISNLCIDIGIDFKVKIITARYTFKSTIANKLNADTVKLLMGHSSEKTQETYLAKTENTIKDYLDQIENI